MAVPTYYAKGQWRACCDTCGQVFKSGMLMRQWNGWMVCSECFEFRNQQELLRIPRPEQPIPWSRNCYNQPPCGGQQQGTTRTLDSQNGDRISQD